MVKTVSKPGPSPKMTKKKKPTPKRKLMEYSPSKVKLALENIRNGVPLAAASRIFGVPRATLWNKVNNRAPETTTHVGFTSILPQETEKEIVDWLLKMSDRGFPIDQELLLDSVKQLVVERNIKNSFKDNRPGRKWFENFLRRHPTISKKHAEGLTTTRASITEERIRDWFCETHDLLKADLTEQVLNKILKDPRRNFNIDETAVFLSPKGSTILGRKGKSVYSVSKNDEKTCITVMLCVSADGGIAPPCALFSYKRLPAAIAKNAPQPWGVGSTERGWMTGQSFYEYIANVFIPYLQEEHIPLPVILYLDGHCSHLTVHLHDLCVQNKIILVALPPNTTHLMQPLDVSVFRPLKQDWKYIVRRWRIEHGEEICKENFCRAVHKAIFKDSLKKSIVNGFKATGIHPFDPNSIDFSKLIVHKDPPAKETPKKSPQEMSHLEYLESKLSRELLEAFEENYLTGRDWEGDIQAAMLFDTWKLIKEDITNPILTPERNNLDKTEVDEQPNLLQTPDFQEVSMSEPDFGDNLEQMSMEQLLETADVIFEDEMTTLGEKSECVNIEPNIPDSDKDVLPIMPNFSELQPHTSKETPHCKRNILDQLTFWPGELKNSKGVRRKPNPMPSVVTSNAWKQYFEEKERVKKMKEDEKNKKKDLRQSKQKKTVTEDWTCFKCQESYNQEKKMKLSRTWIECDNCKKTFHFGCIPKKHLVVWDINEEDLKSGTLDFRCHICIAEDVELSDD